MKVGELQVWDVVNTTRMDHPFHLHGFFFQVLEINGKKPAWRSMEDVTRSLVMINTTVDRASLRLSATLRLVGQHAPGVTTGHGGWLGSGLSSGRSDRVGWPP